MDSSMIKDQNKNAEAKVNFDHPSINSHSPTFLLHDNGFNSSDQVSDIELISIQSVSYTSLKDLFSSPSLQPGISSASNNNSSCNEISIKNPLVKHAALAYLKPMLSPMEMVERGSFGKIKEMCSGESGCLFWSFDVLWRHVKDAFWESKEEVDDDDSYEDEEYKVD
ncbi:hypothetical protein Goshw_010313 [Gossypium schwendimanii]|uniref:Uncharacterized protein n=1 Tax=Gossypium schwendimanii TaxID=34291 RepID=A0A7J9KRF2_GOSSC|nr:hypothetical protein [Gossypium schwendimanii]